MKCKICGAYNEDYLEYCENCAAPLIPDSEADEERAYGRDDAVLDSAADSKGAPPVWGFVRAPQWPQPEFSADTVSEEDIPESYFRRFAPRPAETPEPAEAAAPAAEHHASFYNDVRVRGQATDAELDAPYYHAPERKSTAPAAPGQNERAYESPPKAAPKKPAADDDYFDYETHISRSRRSRRNATFLIAAAALVVIIAVFSIILINRNYGGSISTFFSCVFAGNPINKAPTVVLGQTDDGSAAYIITVYAKKNHTVRFTAGDLVKETPITKGSLSLRIPVSVWIPNEPIATSELRIKPNIVVISPDGKETPLEFDEEIVIPVPSVTLSLTSPTVTEFTTDTPTISLTGTVGDNTAGVYIGDAQIAVDEGGNFATTYTLPGTGTYDITVEARKNGYQIASQTIKATYGSGSATGQTTPGMSGIVTGNVNFAIDASVVKRGTASSITVTGTMEEGATISVSGVDLVGSVAMQNGTFSFTVSTPTVGLYTTVITALKGTTAATKTLYLEHHPEKDAYMSSVYRLDYERIRDYPNHEQGYKVVGTITELIQSEPYVIAKITTTAGDLIFSYYSGVSTVAANDGKTYEVYADPAGIDETTGLPHMHAWFILKKANG